ncbi:hypothetical protein PsAD2_03553 [Pseudovibrio axinellae]|uniref:Uncharacterized protein n=1 Tax=Pseudovibrio axinellae TaxID=989403 RepID=A0A165VZX8_9HYPH|nr:hypothetical protein PsAD2_03553 [Pseudovibrio axinellae]SER81031.1 hypothetical protein SAMN05421798_12612 [Pseudovibrio axinellae]
MSAPLYGKRKPARATRPHQSQKPVSCTAALSETQSCATPKIENTSLDCMRSSAQFSVGRLWSRAGA